MQIGILNVRWGKLRPANRVAIYTNDREFVAAVSFWVSEGRPIVAITDRADKVEVRGSGGDGGPSMYKGTCPRCGGPLEPHEHVEAWNEDGTPSKEDTYIDPYCRKCDVFWIDFEPLEKEIPRT